MSVDTELLEIFRDEAVERLDRMESLLLAVESGSPPAGAVDELFRDAHSIKGSAGMVGLAEVSTITGAVEDVLEDARATGAIPAGAVGPILQVVDAVRGALEGADIDVPRLLDAVRASARAGAPDAQAAAGGLEPLPAPAPAGPEPPEDPSSSSLAPRGSGRMLRVPADRVDELLDATGEAVLGQRRMEHVVGGDEALREELDRSGALLGELQHAVIGLRTLPFSSISAPLRRAVRDAAARAGIEVRLDLDGSQTALDRTILDGLTDPLVHLLRNAISHGIEMPDERERAGKPREGVVRLSASSRGDRVLVVVADDGRGVSPALLDRAAREGSLVDVLAAPGFSTAAGVDDLSGRGVGLDAVKRHVSGLGGSLEVTSRTGVGTEFTLVLPATLAVLHLLLVERDGQAFGVPLTGVMEAVEVGQTATLGGRATLQLHGEAVPVVDLLDVLGGASAALATGPALIVGSAGHRAAVRCDRLIGDEEAVVKSLGGLLSGLEAYLGAAILGDGRVALICDPGHLARATGRTGARAASHREPAATSAAPRLLVVDDQITIRELQRSILGAAGYDVLTARDGREALDALERAPDVQLVLTDVEMPVLDGFGLLEQIRAHPVHGSLPVIIVSSRGDEADRRRGAEAGADAYVVKSEFDQRSLLATVQRLVGAR